MARQFEFRLIDGAAPEGELEADHLLAIVESLKEVAMKLGRTETAAETVGRPPKRTQRVAKLSIGLAAGSTRLLVRRSESGQEVLPFEVDEEREFDEKFQEIVESIAADLRPEWVPAPLARAAGNLRSALEVAAPIVEFKAGNEVQCIFRTKETQRETWKPVEAQTAGDMVTFVGRLRAVNLDTHRLTVTDDLGNKVTLPSVVHDAGIGHLLGEYVTVIGAPERSSKGSLTQIHDAEIVAAPALPDELRLAISKVVTLEQILTSAPGPGFGGIADLTDEQADDFLDALGL
ncbi:hypothetical protein SAMN02745244_03484 [Tessaracoccus bendigoensis DSM 12906]|uniref:Uncharacterized protein n=1 Tax=Tessaracoccus bendigoensis DSM 12906 TaxID=1123357 RepID=A0A1M6MWY8_9ACTN|nr:hypothetical protein [Tessaracoccus bendigoensis]SHJ87942.1 hypothetical protein SAMN02745244_03484 [Tessaracoccus bendigoensis DSM 12906]